MKESKGGETFGHLRVAGARLAWRRISGGGPTVLWLGGFRSEMSGTKASALADWATASGRAFVRLDYFGHGKSDGDFAEGTISRWRQDALAALDRLVDGPAILVGSSMGAWLACLATMARPERVAGLVLIAPAVDFTDALLIPNLPPAALAKIAAKGAWTRPSARDGDGYPITAGLLEDGARWSILPGPIAVEAPVRILQGGEDPDVPWTHALAVARALKSRDVVFTLINDGDHRLSRPADLARLIAAVAELSGGRR